MITAIVYRKDDALDVSTILIRCVRANGLRCKDQ